MNWLVPAMLLGVVSVLLVVVTYLQPNIQHRLREQQAKIIEPQIKAGKLTQADADRYLDLMEKVAAPILSVSVVVVSFIRVLWWALVLWLLGRMPLKVKLGYPKALEVAGLAMMISVLGTIVTLLLTVNLARMVATPSLALVVSDFDETRKSHLFLAAVNVFSVWFIGVMSVGLAKLAGAPFLRAAFLVFAVWVLQDSLFILSGLGRFAL